MMTMNKPLHRPFVAVPGTHRTLQSYPPFSKHQRLIPCAHQQSHTPSDDTSCARRTAILVSLATLTLGTAATPPAALAKTPGDWSTPGLASSNDEVGPKFFKTPNGVAIQLLAEGTGADVNKGDKVLLDYVLRRSNGYFIYGTLEGVSFQPSDVPAGPVALELTPDKTIPGLIEGLQGMQVGGKRRILVPPTLGYTIDSSLEPKMPTFGTQRQLENHKKEPLLFEVQLLRIIR